MRRRGKDEGFHPHPGDPWHPGWSPDEEPPGAAGPAAAPEEGELPAEKSAVGEAAAAAVSASAEPGGGAGATLPARPAPATEESGDWTQILGVYPEPPAAVPAASADEGIPQTLFGWTAAEPPVGEAAAGPPAEPSGPALEHLPPPWSPDEAGEVEEAEAPEEWVEAEPAGEPIEAEAPVGPRPEAAAAAAAGAVEPVSPPWSPDEAEEEDRVGPAGAGAAPAGPAPPGPHGSGLPEGEAEVEAWLAFAGGEATDGVATAGGEQPFDIAAGGAAEAGAGAAAPRRRLWPFGRRERPGEASPEGRAEEEWAGAAEAGEQAGPQPPPWSPDELAGEPAPAGIEGWAAAGGGTEAVESWESLPAGPESTLPAAEPREAGEAPPPPPWVVQSELDRAAPIPVIPPIEAEGRGAEPEPNEWAEEAGWVEDVEWAEPAPTEHRAAATAAARPENWGPEEAEEWEQLPGPGAAAEPAGVPTVEIPVLEAAELRDRRAPGDLLSEEMFAGAVTSEHRDLAAEVAAADTAEAQMQAVSAPMAGLESGVVGFEDVVELGGEPEAEEEAPARSDLPLRVVTALVLVGLLVGAVWVGGGLLAGFIGLLAFIGVGEMFAALRRSGYRPLALFGLLGAAGLLAATWYRGLVAVPIAVVALTILCFFYYTLASRRRDPLINGSLTLLGMLWVAGTLAFAFPIVAAPEFRVLVVALVATVVATDVGAYFAGRAWGSRPLAAVLSPHKTVEGLAGGVVLGIAVAVLIGHFFEPLNLRIGAGLGLVVAVMAPLGDLAESMVKRSLGVKDMGSLLPGHGGVLDRVDAFLFVVPAVWVLYETLGLLR